MACTREAGFEPATSGLEVRRSIQAEPLAQRGQGRTVAAPVGRHASLLGDSAAARWPFERAGGARRAVSIANRYRGPA